MTMIINEFPKVCDKRKKAESTIGAIRDGEISRRRFTYRELFGAHDSNVRLRIPLNKSQYKLEVSE